MQPQDNTSPETNPIPPASPPTLPTTPEPTAPAPSPGAPATPSPDIQPPTPTAPVSGIVVGGQQPTVGGADTVAPIGSTVAPDSPVGAPASPAPVTPPAPAKKSKKWLIIIVLLLLLVGGAAAFYFGYYKNPSVMLGKSMVNTGKGYDKLVDYYDQQSTAKYKGAVVDGSLSLTSAGVSADGDLTFKSDDKNLAGTVNVNVMGTKISADLVAITPANSTLPDLYIKPTNLKELASLSGLPQLTAAATSLDGKWVVVDHTLLSSLNASVQQQAKQSYPTQEQVVDYARAFGEVNKQYIFTNKKDKAIAEASSNMGAEKIDGHNTYHYEMVIDKANLKAYLNAQKAALKSSKLNDWIKANNYESAVDDYFTNSVKSVDQIKDNKRAFDLWIDTDAKLVYKVRFSDDKNPATNYADLGLGYKGGSEFPFFVNLNTKDSGTTTTGKLNFVLNTSTNVATANLDIKATGTDAMTAKFNLKYKPTNDTVKVTAPTGAIPVTQVLTQLGIPIQ